MGKCEATAHRNEGYSGWARTVTDNSTSGGYHNIGSGATSFFVDAHDKNCLITVWAGEDFTGRGRFMRNADHIGIDQRRRWNEPNWNDDTESMRVERIPSANANELEYDINILRYTPSSPGDNHCGGCRWWPEVKNRGDPKNADRDDVLLVDLGEHGSWQDNKGDEKTGRPCPGGKGYFQSNTGVRCIYNKNIGSSLETLSKTIKDQGITGDPRQPMYDSLKNDICSKAENLNTIVTHDGKTCKDWDTSKTLAKGWCQKDNNIVDDTLNLCTPEHLGTDLYNTLAEAYCENNPDKAFCACYNVMQPGFCEQAPNAPGCKTVQPIWDNITQSLDEGDIAQFEGMQPCYGSVCGGTVYKPTGWDTNCNKDISICKADFDIGALVDSNIIVKQNCGNDSGDGDGDGSGSGSGGSTEEKTLIEKMFKIEEDKDKKFTEKKTTKMIGTVSSISGCFMCMFAIITFT